MTQHRSSERPAPRRRISGLVLIGLLLLVATATVWGYALLAEMPLPGFELSAESAAELIRSWGAWGVVATIGLMVVHSFVPFPAEFVALAAGMVYGPVWGTVITWTGAMLGAWLSFGLARLFGRPLVETLVRERYWSKIDAWTERQGASTLLVSRLIPVIAFNLINYAAGLTTMRWWTFTWATGLGILPLTALMVTLGHRMEALGWLDWLLIGLAACTLWGVYYLVRRRAGSGEHPAARPD